MLVFAHSNNKRDNGSNSISVSDGIHTYTTLSGGNSGGQAGAWIFYTTVTSNTNIFATFDTSNTTKTASTSTTYYVLRAGAGETIVLADSQTTADVSGTSLGATLNASATGGYGIMTTVSASSAISGTPTGFTENVRSSNDKRVNWSNANIGAGELNPSVTVDSADFEAMVAASFVSVPEPSSTALLGLGGLALLLRRRK